MSSGNIEGHGKGARSKSRSEILQGQRNQIGVEMVAVKVGMIGLDTSHVVAFTQLLNNPEAQYHVPGAQVICAFPGGSPDWEMSWSRLEGFTQQVQEFGVKIVDSIAEVAQTSDAILLESVDGRVHLAQFREIAPYGKPVFVDKPFAVSYRDAKEMVDLARKYQVPLMSSSALRYAEELTGVLARCEKETIVGADTYGPMAMAPTQPGLFWYGIHAVEMLYAILGRGCRRVTAHRTEDYDVIVGEWEDGRLGTVRGNRRGNNDFGAVVHTTQGSQFVDVYANPKPYYASLLEQVMILFRQKRSPLDIEETLEIVAFIEAANLSRETGRPVELMQDG